MNGDGTLSLSPPSVLLWDWSYFSRTSKRTPAYGGRRYKGWVGHLRHYCASGLVDLMATGASKDHPF